jgi:competence protein ComEC
LLALVWLLASASAVSQQPSTPRPDRSELLIRQLDVGQGDAALIITPEGKRILIDAGHSEDAVASMLRSAGIDTIDLVIASHAHADHIGGMPAVLSAFVVRAYVDNGIPYTTGNYARTLSALENTRGLKYLQATRRTITVGSVTLRILPPPLIDRSQNNNSVGALIEFGNFRALYTGDSQQQELSSWLQTEQIPRVTLVKAAHHGSGNAVTEEWVRATKPTVVLISVGANNSYGDPSRSVEQMWASSGAQVLRTDVYGEIDVRANKDGNYGVGTSAQPYRLSQPSGARRRSRKRSQ